MPPVGLLLWHEMVAMHLAYSLTTVFRQADSQVDRQVGLAGWLIYFIFVNYKTQNV